MLDLVEVKGPYQTLAVVAPARVVTARCCGRCHPAVGGCVYGIVFKRPWWKGGDYPAGKSDEYSGTPPLVCADGVWKVDE